MAHRGRSRRPDQLPLFSGEAESTCRILRRVSLDEGEKMEVLGIWERRYDKYSGELMGFRMAARRDDRDVDSAGHSPAAISAREMQANVDYSHTSGLPEYERLKRQKNGFPAEDHVERVQCKVLVWPLLGPGKKDILRVWPR